MTAHGTVWIVDGDDRHRETAAGLVRRADMMPRTFAHAAGFLGAFDPDVPGCVVLEVRIPGMNGLDVQSRLGRGVYCPPIVFVTTLRDVPTIVQAMKAGAFHFLGKPVQNRLFLKVIRQAVARDQLEREAHATQETLLRAWNRLSGRERQVADLLARGLPARTIADRLGIKPKTVDTHRSNIFDKTGVSSLADLVRLHVGVSGSAIGPAVPRNVVSTLSFA